MLVFNIGSKTCLEMKRNFLRAEHFKPCSTNPEGKWMWSISTHLTDCFLSKARSSNNLRTAKIQSIMVVWMFFAVSLKHFYESNFRANLIMVDYEPTADSIHDLVKLNRRLYIPSGTQFQDMLDGYPDPDFNYLGQLARQEGLMFEYDQQGLVEYEVEQEILENGEQTRGFMCVKLPMYNRVFGH